MTKRTAVIGAGMAGLACARVLRRAGCYVEVFDKERIIGGRISTARLGVHAFDTGAQYITARSDVFKTYIDEVVGTGYASRWQPKFSNGHVGNQLTPWYVGTPGMHSLVRPLTESVRLHTERTVHTIQRSEKGWHLWFEDETSAGPFHAVAVAIPAAQAQLLLGRIDALANPLSRVRMSPCWSLMARLDDRLLPDQDVYSDMSEVIRWICRNNAKPGRQPRGDQIIVHASQSWSRETEDADPEAVADELWAEVGNVLGLPPARPTQMAATLWRHGLVDQSLGETFLFSSEHMVGVAGDWCLGRLAEHAYESGVSLGRAIVNSL
ncbi:MAG TPA: FAD-dependent oxidoreductase [Hyphomicrobiaceae bacterium]|nr:FAD-dependent oxidoreductase [Hyphomicrobiaceae bacterium]